MTTPHVGDELPALLAGELSSADTATVLGHLAGCPACTVGLHETLRGHAALAHAARVLRTASAVGAAPPPPLPPLVLPRHRPRRLGGAHESGRRLGRAAAALALVAGSAGGTYALTRPGHGPQPRTLAAGALRPVAGGTAPGAGGSVTMADMPGDTAMVTVTAGGLPQPGRGGFYEVWLLRPGTGRMLPVGVLPVGLPAAEAATGRFEMPAALAAGYTAVDISREADDGNPAHSSDSVLRAPLS